MKNPKIKQCNKAWVVKTNLKNVKINKNSTLKRGRKQDDNKTHCENNNLWLKHSTFFYRMAAKFKCQHTVAWNITENPGVKQKKIF